MSGRDRLTADELAAAEPRHKVRSEFLALLYFAHLLPPERMAVVLDGMLRASWAQVLAEDLAGEFAEMTPGHAVRPRLRPDGAVRGARLCP